MKTRQKFATEIATPLCDIFYSSIIESVVSQSQFPKQIHQILPVTLGLCPIPCKLLERISAKELWKALPPNQIIANSATLEGALLFYYLIDLILGPFLFLIMVYEGIILHDKVYKYVDMTSWNLVTGCPQPSVRMWHRQNKILVNNKQWTYIKKIYI